MEFDSSFDVPLAPAQAWTLLMDIRRIAPCMPGAELTQVIDAQHYKGKIAVRLGPVALAFGGNLELFDIDDAGHTARVKAQGSDAKGRGAANATATFRVEPSGAGSTVRIHTDLMLSGAVAQYGRGVGMIQATAAQIIKQFAGNLKAQLAKEPVSVPAAQASSAVLHNEPLSVPTAQAASAILPKEPVSVATGPASSAMPHGPARPATVPPPASSEVSPPLPAAKPISGFSLLGRIIWEDIVGLLRRRRH